ncbi:MAG: DUF4175 family protein [Thermomicrobiales bacterium]
MPERQALLLRHLRRRRVLARAILLFERTWPAVWPALGVLGLFLCLALLDVPPALPALVHLLLLVLVAGAAGWLLVRGLRRVTPPGDAEADRRLEQASGLRHRPLAVLRDRPATPGLAPGDTDTLWRAHLARAVAAVGRLRVGWPHPGLAARDPYALRGALVVGLVACLGIAGADAPARLARALLPGGEMVAAHPITQVQAWITPPAYTGLAPLFLRPAGGTVSVPAGSHLTVSVTGNRGEPTLMLAGAARRFQPLDSTSFQADAELVGGGRLAVRRGGHELAGWDVTVVADSAPVVSWPEPPGEVRGGGRGGQTRLPWQVSDAYGVVHLGAELRLRDRPDAPALQVPIPLPGGTPKSARGARQQDLTAHPWAGLAVVARLLARGAAGLTGTSPEAVFVLPERPFQNPASRVLMQVRKLLTLRPDERLPRIVELDQLSALTGIWQDDLPAFLNLRGIASQLYRDQSDTAVGEAQARLWDSALHLEEGAADRTAQGLEQARQALREALEAQARGEKVENAEIERRMQEVRDALARHLRALAEQAERFPDQNQYDPDAHVLDTRDMERLAEEMREAAREGRMDEAREKLAELERMLDEMKTMPRGPGQMTERERQRAEKRQKGQQQMDALQDIVRRLGTILDHVQERGEPGLHR